MTTEELKEIARAVEQELAKRTQTVEELPTSDNLADFVTLPVLGRDGSMKTLKAELLKGEKGDTGQAGPRGETGAAGPQGVQGPRGLQCIQGAAGERGPKGDAGQRGADGRLHVVDHGTGGDNACPDAEHDARMGRGGEPEPYACPEYGAGCTGGVLFPVHITRRDCDNADIAQYGKMGQRRDTCGDGRENVSGEHCQ